jgi:hypothetical protein
VDATQFLSRRRQLVEAYEKSVENIGCFEVKGCRACVDCMFSTDCARCYKLTYSTGCTDSSNLTQSVSCHHSHALVYCEDCDFCTRCNYLMHSVRCSDCDYCFGCVGLTGKDFHILNVPYRRGEYFKLVKQIQAGLKALGRSAVG